MVLVLDDLQWADVESLELLTSMVGRLADTPLLIVGSVRELEVGRNDTVVSTLAVLTRSTGARRLRLRGLASDATDALVVQTAGDALDPAAAASIHARAEGNPFFATELARLLAGGHGLPTGDVPSGVRDVVRQRLGLLPPRTAELLNVAAVIGRYVDLRLLAAASGRDLDSCLDDLEPAIVHRLLVDVPDHPVYRFAHALVREVVVDDVSSLRRARLHLKVADALDDVDDHAEIRAEHLWQAVPIGVAGRAAAALERATGSPCGAWPTPRPRTCWSGRCSCIDRPARIPPASRTSSTPSRSSSRSSVPTGATRRSPARRSWPGASSWPRRRGAPSSS